MQKVLKPENKHICINARNRKPANKLVQVVNDEQSTQGRQSHSRKAEWWVENAQTVPVTLPAGLCQGLSHSMGLLEMSSNNMRGYRWNTWGTRQCQPNWWYPAFPGSLGHRVGKET